MNTPFFQVPTLEMGLFLQVLGQPTALYSLLGSCYKMASDRAKWRDHVHSYIEGRQGVNTTLMQEEAWLSGQCVRLAIRQSQVRVLFWQLAGFVLGHPKFKSSVTLVKSQLVASQLPVGVFNPVMLYLNYFFLSI